MVSYGFLSIASYDLCLNVPENREHFGKKARYYVVFFVSLGQELGPYPSANLLQSEVGGWGWGVNQAYSRLSTTHGHITDCKLDSVVYAGVCEVI